jgi:prepilin-type processing-associated H-X9-DG protein
MLTYPTKTESIVDYPASYHGGAGGFSFVDGHSELKKWSTPKILAAPLKGQVRPYPTPLGAEYNRDIVWMQERATRLIP